MQLYLHFDSFRNGQFIKSNGFRENGAPCSAVLFYHYWDFVDGIIMEKMVLVQTLKQNSDDDDDDDDDDNAYDALKHSQCANSLWDKRLLAYCKFLRNN
jgi:hypothetical protein